MADDARRVDVIICVALDMTGHYRIVWVLGSVVMVKGFVGAHTASLLTRMRAAPAAARGSPRTTAIRSLLDASPLLVVMLGLWTVVNALAPIVLLVVVGGFVGLLLDTDTGGSTGAPDQSAISRSLALSGVMFAVVLVLPPLLEGLRALVRVRLTYRLQRRLMSAMSGPPGIGHLEDPQTLGRLAMAQGTLTSYFPADSPAALAAVMSNRATGVVACLVVGTFRWWLGLWLLALWLGARRPLQRILFDYVSAFGGDVHVMRRADYFRQLLTRPGSARELRVYGLVAWLIGQFRERWDEGMQAAWAVLARYRRSVTLLGLAVAGTYCVAAWVMADAARSGSLTVAALATLLPMLVVASSTGTTTFDDVQLQWMLAAMPDLSGLEAEFVGRPLAAVPRRAVRDLPKVEVRFEQVAFAYPRAEQPVFRSLDLVLEAGRSTAVVGINGAGKTTLVKLLCRLYEPTAGRILVDSEPLTRFGARSWQRNVAVVFQDFVHYPMTLVENVAMTPAGEPVAPEWLERAAERAGLGEVVGALPDGWSTILSTRYPGGVDLSGGQWQKVALARALYAVERGARILVLDEPTAALDARGEAEFFDRFLSLTSGVTTVVISHRFSTVRRADRICILEDGRVVEQGGHDEMLQLRGRYHELFTLQSARFQAPLPRRKPGRAVAEAAALPARPLHG